MPCTIIAIMHDLRMDNAFGERPTRSISTCAACNPGALVTVLQTIVSIEIDTALVWHSDQELIIFCPELEEPGWSHEIEESHCGDCEVGFMLRMVRYD